MLVQLVHVHVKPDRVPDVIEALRINYEGTIRERGNLRFDILQDAEDEAHFMIYEVFESETALQEHRQTPHFERCMELLEPLRVAPPTKDILHLVMPGREGIRS